MMVGNVSYCGEKGILDRNQGKGCFEPEKDTRRWLWLFIDYYRLTDITATALDTIELISKMKDAMTLSIMAKSMVV